MTDQMNPLGDAPERWEDMLAPWQDIEKTPEDTDADEHAEVSGENEESNSENISGEKKDEGSGSVLQDPQITEIKEEKKNKYSLNLDMLPKPEEDLEAAMGMTGSLNAGMTGPLIAGMTGNLRSGMTGTLTTGMTGPLAGGMTGTLYPGMTGNLTEADWHRNWMSDADAGYSDTFHALKKQIDFNYKRYKAQLKDIPRRKDELKKELWHAIWNLAKYLIVFPLICWGIVELFLFLGVKFAVFSPFYMIAKIITYPLCIISIFFGTPPSVRDLVDVRKRFQVLNDIDKAEKYREDKQLLTFEEEEVFLRRIISDHDRFYERIKEEGLDKVGGGEENISIDDLTPKQEETLALMRKLSEFQDVQARPGEYRKQAGHWWLVLGLILLLGVPLMLLFIESIKMSQDNLEAAKAAQEEMQKGAPATEDQTRP